MKGDVVGVWIVEDCGDEFCVVDVECLVIIFVC